MAQARQRHPLHLEAPPPHPVRRRAMGYRPAEGSALCNGRLASFSSERLMRLPTALGHDVEIAVSPELRSGAHGRMRVVEVAG
jgi:hypothetical protein